MTITKLNRLAIKIENFLSQKAISDDKLKIINDMVDGIDRIIDTWHKFK